MIIDDFLISIDNRLVNTDACADVNDTTAIRPSATQDLLGFASCSSSIDLRCYPSIPGKYASDINRNTDGCGITGNVSFLCLPRLLT